MDSIEINLQAYSKLCFNISEVEPNSGGRKRPNPEPENHCMHHVATSQIKSNKKLLND